MLQDDELAQARGIVSQSLSLYSGNRDKTILHIQEMCKTDPNLLVLFAKVGIELFDASQSVKH